MGEACPDVGSRSLGSAPLGVKRQTRKGNPMTPFSLSRASVVLAALPFVSVVSIHAAAEPLDAAVGQIEDVIVTATRVPTPAARVNVPVEILERDQLEMRQAQSLGDLLIGSPGIAIARSGGVGALSELRMRGAESNHVLVLIDGVDANDPALGSRADISHIDLTGVERIEILRGPQSALWGTDALAGVISIRTISRPTTPSGRINLESGSHGTGAIDGEFRTGNGRAWLGIGGNGFRTDGIDVSGGAGRDGYRNRTLHANSGYDAERWSIGAVLRQTLAESEYDPTPAPAFVPVEGDREFDTRQRFARVHATFAATPSMNQTLTVGYLDTDNENLAEGTRTNRSDARRLRIAFQNDWNFGWTGGDARITFALERQTEDFTFRAPASPWGDPNQDQSISANSLVLEYDVAIGDDLGLTLSGRADRNSAFDDVLAGRASMRYQRPDWGSRVFVSIGTGVNNPTFTERFGFTPDTFLGNPALKPERSLSMQLVLEQQVTAWLLADAAIFRDRLIDEIDGFAFDAERGGFTAVNRDGRSRRQGIELGGRLHATDSLSIRVGYGYLDATEPGSDGQLRELRRPRHTGRLAADVRAFSDRLRLQLGTAYVGRSFDHDFGTFPARRVVLGSYWLAHTAARYHVTDTWSVFGRLENAFDANYQTVFGYHTPGRTAHIGVTADL
jgi:vitamin B12 transporter